MRTLVTGAAGFLGQAVAQYMAATGYPGEVKLTDRTLPPRPNKGLFCSVAADLSNLSCVRVLLDRVDRVLHLAALRGGLAEADPMASLRINHDVPIAMLETLASRRNPIRFVQASSDELFGAPLPDGISDMTVAVPTMIYGQHKVQVEEAITKYAFAGDVDAWVLRLPALVARPDAGRGLTSAFMSSIFEALKLHQRIVLPVSPAAKIWILSTEYACAALIHGLTMPSASMDRAVTLPALRVSIAELVDAIARATGSTQELVGYAPDPGIEAQLGRLPPLSTPKADGLGFRHDGTLDALVERALASLDHIKMETM